MMTTQLINRVGTLSKHDPTAN